MCHIKLFHTPERLLFLHNSIQNFEDESIVSSITFPYKGRRESYIHLNWFKPNFPGVEFKMNLLYSSAVLSSLKSSTRTILTSSQSNIGTKPSMGKGVQTSIRTSSQEYMLAETVEY